MVLTDNGSITITLPDKEKKMKRPDVLKREDGFTLIEIIAVLILLGILAAVAVPKYMDLTEEARNRAAESAIAEVQARLSMGYGQFLLENNGTEPANITEICTLVNDTDILPLDPATATTDDVDLGDDFTVDLAADGTITVEEVQGEALTTAITGTWELP